MNTKVIFNARKTDGNTAFEGFITFNEIDVNIGNGHDGAKFVAPISGLYKFSFFGVTGYGYPGLPTNYTMINVMKNYVMKYVIFDDNNENYHVGNNLAMTWIWDLKKEEHVAFEVTGRRVVATYSSPIIFTGELIHKN